LRKNEYIEKNKKKRFGIEEMFRDFKTGGYQINKTYLHGDRLISLIVLITIAYSSAFLLIFPHHTA